MSCSFILEANYPAVTIHQVHIRQDRCRQTQTTCLFVLLDWIHSKQPLAWCTVLQIKVDANMPYIRVATETDPTLNLTAGVKRIGSDGRWFVLQHQRCDQSNCSMKDFCARRNRVGSSWQCRDDNYLSSAPAAISVLSWLQPVVHKLTN